MFDSTLFDSSFWEYFIIVPTLGGILGLFLLTLVLSGGKRPRAGEDVETMGHTWDDNLQEYNNPLPLWWLNMFYITMAFGVVYLILYPGLGSFAGILGQSQIKDYQAEVQAAETQYKPLYDQYKAKPITLLVEDQDALRIGQRLFSTYCTTCHGADAGGAVGFPNLRDQDWLWGGTPEAIETTIKKGRMGNMAAWGATLGEEGVKDTAQYVLSLTGRQRGEEAAKRGEVHFKKICIACHGMDGKGNQALGAPNLTDKVWLHGGSQASIEKIIREGKQNRMPAQGDFLGDAKVHLLATYVYSLQSKNLNQ